MSQSGSRPRAGASAGSARMLRRRDWSTRSPRAQSASLRLVQAAGRLVRAAPSRAPQKAPASSGGSPGANHSRGATGTTPEGAFRPLCHDIQTELASLRGDRCSPGAVRHERRGNRFLIRRWPPARGGSIGSASTSSSGVAAQPAPRGWLVRCPPVGAQVWRHSTDSTDEAELSRQDPSMPELLRTMPDPDRLGVLKRQRARSGRPPLDAAAGNDRAARHCSGHTAARAAQMTTDMSPDARRHRRAGPDSARSPSGRGTVAQSARRF